MGIGIPCRSPLKGGRPYSTEVVPRLAPMLVVYLFRFALRSFRCASARSNLWLCFSSTIMA